MHWCALRQCSRSQLLLYDIKACVCVFYRYEVYHLLQELERFVLLYCHHYNTQHLQLCCTYVVKYKPKRVSSNTTNKKKINSKKCAALSTCSSQFRIRIFHLKLFCAILHALQTPTLGILSKPLYLIDDSCLCYYIECSQIVVPLSLSVDLSFNYYQDIMNHHLITQ